MKCLSALLSALLATIAAYANSDQGFTVHRGSAEKFENPAIAQFLDEAIFQPAQKALTDCGLSPRFIALPDTRASMYFNNEDIDLDLAKALRDPRFKNAIRIDTPVYRSTLFLWSGKNIEIESIADLSDLTGVRVINMAVNHDDVLSTTYGIEASILSGRTIEAKSLLTALKFLQAGRGDYLVWGDVFSSKLIEAHQLTEVKKVTSIPAKPYLLYSWLAKKHENKKPCIEAAYQQHFPNQPQY